MTRLLWCLPLILGACTSLGPLRPAEPGQVAHYIESQEFQRAERALRGLDERQRQASSWRGLQRRLDQAVRDYEQSTLQRVARLQSEAQWGEALALLEQASLRLPDSRAIQAASRRLKARQEAAMALINTRQLLNYAQFKLRELALMREEARIEPDNQYLKWQISNSEAHLAELAQKLTARSEHVQGDAHLAGEVNRVVGRLLGDEAREVQALSVDPPAQTRPQSAKPLEPELARLLAMAETYLKDEQLAGARTAVNRAAALAPDNAQVLAVRQRVEEAIFDEVERLSVEAGRLYRLSQVAEARALWRQVLVLDPDNQAARLAIERATRILDNLERLRQQQGGMAPP